MEDVELVRDVVSVGICNRSITEVENETSEGNTEPTDMVAE